MMIHECNIANGILKAVMSGLIELIANCSSYHKRCEGFTTTAYILRALTWMLRSEECLNIREALQTACYNAKVVFNAYHHGIRGTILKSNPSSQLIEIFRQGLSFLAATICDHAPNADIFAKSGFEFGQETVVSEWQLKQLPMGSPVPVK